MEIPEDKLVNTIEDDELMKIKEEKDSAYNYRERRHDDWKENYTLYRGKVQVNRLTQRQTIHIPLMKYGLATILKDIKDIATINYVSKVNDEERQIVYNEKFKDDMKRTKNKIVDRVKKKTACLYGRYFRKLNIVNGKFHQEIVLPENVLIDRYVDPLNIDSARILIHVGIFKPLTEVLANENYDKDELAKISNYYNSENGSLESETNQDRMNKMVDKMRDMGVKDASNPYLAVKIVEINEVYRFEYNADTQQFEYMLYEVLATAVGQYFKLRKRRLEDVMGETLEGNKWRTHLPFTTGSADPEADDFWNDAPADTIRPANKVLNSYVSSLVENRILKNFMMKYYNAKDPTFVPQSFVPSPFAWFPIPGNPKDLISDVPVGDLTDSLQEMQYILGISEKAIAATSVQTGELPSAQVKLGQTQIAVKNATERTKDILIGVEDEEEDFARKYNWLMESTEGVSTVLTKKGKDNKMVYSKAVKKSDYMDQWGFIPEVSIGENMEEKEVSAIQKLQVAKEEMPNNMPLKTIIKKRMLSFAGMTPDEIKEVMDYENNNSMEGQVLDPMVQNQTAMINPQVPQLPNLQ